jgi:ABC-type lipoprotein export system ATPase subunit
MRRTEQKFSSLEIKSINNVAKITKEYIIDRKNSKQKSLRVKSEKINSCFMNGFDWNRIITVAGLSGSGKSTLVRQWIREMIENNDDEFKHGTKIILYLNSDQLEYLEENKISDIIKKYSGYISHSIYLLKKIKVEKIKEPNNENIENNEKSEDEDIENINMDELENKLDEDKVDEEFDEIDEDKVDEDKVYEDKVDEDKG